MKSAKAYSGYISAAGDQLVVVEMTLKSTYSQAVTIYDSDFQLFWDTIDPDGLSCMPVEYYCSQQLPSQFDLASKESRSGVLVYQVPEDQQAFHLAFQEVFDDGTQEGRMGELYVMDLSLSS